MAALAACVVMALGGGDRVVRIGRPASSIGAVSDAAEWRVTRQHERFAFLDPRGGSRMKAEHVKSRLHGAMHRGSKKATEEEVAEVAAVVLAIVTEVTAELALVIAELAERVEQLEVRAG